MGKGNRVPAATRALNSQLSMVIKAKKVLKLSEDKLIQALEGKLNIPDNVVVHVALELYKRRIPMKIEKEVTGSSNNLTIVKVFKNHIPDAVSKNTFDVNLDKVEILAEKALETRKEIKI